VSQPRSFYVVVFTFLFVLQVFAQDSLAKLPQKKVFLCNEQFLTWVASTEETRQRGLMDFRQLKSNEAMLFIFENEQERSFWMKNVPHDLDIAFFKKNKELLSRMTMKGTSPLTQEAALPVYRSEGAARYALETVGGRLKKISSKCKLIF